VLTLDPCSRDTSRNRAYLCIALINGLSVVSISSRIITEAGDRLVKQVKQCCGIDQNIVWTAPSLTQESNRVRLQ